MKKIMIMFSILVLLSLTCISASSNGDSEWVMFGRTADHASSYDTGEDYCEYELLWEYNSAGRIKSSPVVQDGVVYFGGFIYSTEGQVFAVDAITGEEKWTIDWPHNSNSVDYTGVIDDGVYYVTGTVYTMALDADDGSTIWRENVAGNDLVMSQDILYVGGSNFVAMDKHNGDIIWEYTLGGSSQSSPAVYEDKVFTGSHDGKMYALDADDGTLLWEYQTGSQLWTPPTVVDDVVYFGSHDEVVYALDADDGTLLWDSGLITWHKFISSPAVYENKVFIGSHHSALGSLFVFDADDGTLLWKYKVESAISSSPAVVDGVVYFGSDDGKMYALDHNDGTLLWEYQTGGAIESSPAVVDGVVYFGSDDGKMYALELLPSVQETVCQGDTDGDNPYITGHAGAGQNLEIEDECVSSVVLKESYCEDTNGDGNSELYTKYYDCINGCSNGACIACVEEPIVEEGTTLGGETAIAQPDNRKQGKSIGEGLKDLLGLFFIDF